jgi:hypothetical protein
MISKRKEKKNVTDLFHRSCNAIQAVVNSLSELRNAGKIKRKFEEYFTLSYTNFI